MKKTEFMPWLLVPGIMLTLSSVTLLAPLQTAKAASPGGISAKLQPAPKAAVVDDGEGDELLEHWGDPQYSREEQKQMAGIAGALVLLGIVTLRRRSRKQNAACEIVRMPTEADFLKLDSRNLDSRDTDSRKAA